MDRILTSVEAEGDIFPEWRGTPISDFLAYHNLRHPYRVYDRAKMAVVMCMDCRKALRIPDGFAYILRTGGGNPSRVAFEISYAIAVGGVRAMALIAHDDCGMVSLNERRDAFVQGMIQAGWKSNEAQVYFDAHAPLCEISDSVEFVCTEAHRLQTLYPNITVAPLFYSVKDGLLSQLQPIGCLPGSMVGVGTK